VITEQQRLERKKHIGASDVGAIFGLDPRPFKTAADVFASKVYEFEPGYEKKNVAAERGNRHEAACVGYVADTLKVGIQTDSDALRFVCKEHPIFASNLDGYTINPFIFDGVATHDQVIVEAKTTGMADEYGEPGTPDVPYRVLLQVYTQMLCTGWDKAIVVCLMGKHGLSEELYYIERNQKIIDIIVDKCTQFWNGHVLTGIPPKDSIPANLELFKHIVREPESVAVISGEVLYEWTRAKHARLDAEKVEKSARAEVFRDLGDAEAAVFPDGDTFTYFSQKARDLVDLNLLKVKYPDIYAEIATTGRTNRVMRVVKAK